MMEGAEEVCGVLGEVQMRAWTNWVEGEVEEAWKGLDPGRASWEEVHVCPLLSKKNVV